MSKPKLKLSTKQRWVINELIRGHMINEVRVCDLDLDQLLTRLAENKSYTNYAPTKHALQFTIKCLIAKGMIAKDGFRLRAGKSRRVLVATPLGFHLCKPGSVPTSKDITDDSNEPIDDIVVEGFDEL